jgi:hypothetical protein
MTPVPMHVHVLPPIENVAGGAVVQSGRFVSVGVDELDGTALGCPVSRYQAYCMFVPSGSVELVALKTQVLAAAKEPVNCAVGN